MGFFHALDLDGPGADLQVLRRFGNLLVRAVFVEVVVGRGVLLGRQRQLDLVLEVRLGGIEARRRVGFLRQRGEIERTQRLRAGEQDRARGEGLDDAAAIAEQRFRRRLRLGDLPAARAFDQHDGPFPWLCATA